MTPRALTEAERIDWLRLARSENVGPVSFFSLLARFGSAEAALAALPELARRGGRTAPLRIGSRDLAEQELERVQRFGAVLLAACEPGYPAALANIADPPPLLAAGSRVELLQRPAVAIVGARNASTNGRRIAATMARELAEAGWIVVSGLARGIDAAAHQSALGLEPGGTIGVVAGGIDVVYPPEHEQLQAGLFAEGAVVAEMPMGTRPQAGHFPRRNRIVSGLARAVVVVEAALHSGSLISARLAGEQGREVFAVPGSPLDPRARGTNNLLREGAILAESAQDVLRELGEPTVFAGQPPPAGMAEPGGPPWSGPNRAWGPFGGPSPGGQEAPEPDSCVYASARGTVLARLSPAPVAVDELIRDCQLSPSLILSVLLELELAGRIERQPGHRVVLIGALY